MGKAKRLRREARLSSTKEPEKVSWPWKLWIELALKGMSAVLFCVLVVNYLYIFERGINESMVGPEGSAPFPRRTVFLAPDKTFIIEFDFPKTPPVTVMDHEYPLIMPKWVTKTAVIPANIDFSVLYYYELVKVYPWAFVPIH